MDYKKLYEEALERAKEFVCKDNVEVAEYIFPELAESEDERIRKELINYFIKGKEYLSLCSFSKEEILAWLEKQDEHKSVIKMKTPEESIGISSEEYNKIVDKCIYDDDKSTWSEKDERIYQSIIDDTVQENQLSSEQTNWLRDIKYRYFPQPKQEWSEEDKKKINNILNVLIDYKELESEYYWLKSLKL